MKTILMKTSRLSFSLLAVAVAACIVPSATARAGLVLTVDSSAKEFYFTGSDTGTPTIGQATWTVGDTLIDVHMSSAGDGSALTVIKTVRSLTGLGLQQSQELVNAAPGVISTQTPAAAAATLAGLRDVGATMSPRIAASHGATSLPFAGFDGAGDVLMNLHLTDNGFMLDLLGLADGTTSTLTGNSSRTSYASATAAQQASLESFSSPLIAFQSDLGDIQIVQVPEPTSLALLGVGAVGLMARRRRTHG